MPSMPDIKLTRTDTTHDLSQKAEKRYLYTPVMFPSLSTATTLNQLAAQLGTGNESRSPARNQCRQNDLNAPKDIHQNRFLVLLYPFQMINKFIIARIYYNKCINRFHHMFSMSRVYNAFVDKVYYVLDNSFG